MSLHASLWKFLIREDVLTVLTTEIAYKCCTCHKKENICAKTEWNPMFHDGAKQIQERGWITPWLVAGDWMCKECASKLVHAIVPGEGVRLVTKEMIEQGKAFSIAEFEKTK